jgi:ubiquinone/menaquinone biosynthesis C-methylase UbiE
MVSDGMSRSRRFWNDKAAENAYWYVSSYASYDSRDRSEFWASGAKIWNDLKAATGYRPASDHTVVEIGCGVGRLTRAIAPEVQSVLAFDIAEQMLALARQGAPANASFACCEGCVLSNVPDASADATIAYCVFQHLPDLSALASYLREMHRVTKPGGMIAFTATPRTWKDAPICTTLLRARRRVRESMRKNGPRGLYRKEWYGIRPSRQSIMRLVPMPIASTILHGDKWLFYGRK